MGRQAVKLCLPTSNAVGQSEYVDYSRVYIFLGWWPLLFNHK
jgi:hypothetical protein